ncbi:hypothetical protein [Okeania sp. SIO2C9]|nr:hypothetical protein [Okeania sp. SIO2C9]
MAILKVVELSIESLLGFSVRIVIEGESAQAFNNKLVTKVAVP